MQLHVRPNDETPVYRQIERQIAEAIADRRLRPGEALPPEQVMAARLVVSPASVRKAYEELEASGLCQGATASGRHVSTRGPGEDPSLSARRALTLLKRELLAEELASARRVQRRLLPTPRLDNGHWIAEARSCPASTLNGDFYDLFELDGGGLGVALADVAGKGLAAGLLMAVAKSMLAFVAPQRGAAEALRELNRRLCPLLGRREFIALAYARLTADGEGLELANAGLPDPYLLRADGTVTTLVAPDPRLPLGVREQLPYAAARYRFAAGDRLLMTTDGIPEARGRGGEPIGYEGLSRLIRELTRRSGGVRRGSDSAGPWLDRLIDRARDLASPLAEDDWTALVVERRREPE